MRVVERRVEQILTKASENETHGSLEMESKDPASLYTTVLMPIG